MKQVITVAILCIAVMGTALAQQKPADQAAKPADQTAKPAEATPAIDQILEKYVQALGGKAAIEKFTSTASKGTFEIAAFGASGTAEIWEKAPNKNALRLDIPGFGIVEEGFNGTVAWSKDPQSGLREKTGMELAATKLDAEFYKAIKLKALYPKITVKGKEKVGDKDAYVLEATPAEGPVETWYFDVASGLLVRTDTERESPQGKTAVQSFLEDYRDVDGVKSPFMLRNVTPAFTIVIKLEEVKRNVAVDETKFNKPAA